MTPTDTPKTCRTCRDGPQMCHDRAWYVDSMLAHGVVAVDQCSGWVPPAYGPCPASPAVGPLPGRQRR